MCVQLDFLVGAEGTADLECGQSMRDVAEGFVEALTSVEAEALTSVEAEALTSVEASPTPHDAPKLTQELVCEGGVVIVSFLFASLSL